MRFQPSQHSYEPYGFSSAWPLEKLSPTGTGIDNTPTSAAHIANLSLLSNFIGKIPFKVSINSAYRTRAVNQAVGGSSSSQHANGLGVDLQPEDSRLGSAYPGGANRALAAWFYEHQDEFPELDQVIWYVGKSHTHVGICPKGATGCVRGAVSGKGRAQFKVNLGEGSYRPASEFYKGAKEIMQWASIKPKKLFLTLALTTLAFTGAGTAALGLLWWNRARLLRLIGR